MTEGEAQPIDARPYHVFMLALCLFALGILAADPLIEGKTEMRQILEYADLGVCALFLVDFLLNLKRAPNRWRYMYTWGWIDLASSIPMVDVLRVGRAGRIFRIFRVFRGVRAAKLIAGWLLDRRAEGAFLAASLLWILLLVFASIAILEFERGPGSNIRGAEDAIWWAFVTITTVGYGDHYPVTTEGRIVAGFLMTAGVGLFGTFSAFVAAWFLAPSRQKQTVEIEMLHAEIVALREMLTRENSVPEIAETPSKSGGRLDPLSR